MISSPLAGSLLSYFRTCYARDRSLRDTTAYQYERSIRCFGEWLGHEPQLADLDDGVVSSWLADLEKLRLPKTVRGKRQAVLSIWRHAAEAGIVQPPGKIRKTRVPLPNPTAWDLSELRRLIDAAERLPGFFPNGVARKTWFAALFRVAYQTGLRRSDLFCFDVTRDVDADGNISTVQQKTLDGHVSKISAETLELLRTISDRLHADGSNAWRTPLAPPCYVRGVYQWFAKLRQLAGIDGEGAIQQLRRTGATYVEKEHPGAAMRYLGHRTPGLAYRHYVDRSKLGAGVMPPEV